MLKSIPAIQRSLRCNSLLTFIRVDHFSSSSSPELKKQNKNEFPPGNDAVIGNTDRRLKTRQPLGSMVAAAFASLNSKQIRIETPQTDGKLSKAENIEELLSISEGTGVSPRHALKVVSILADWSTSGKVNVSEFESDPRFVKLCRTLTKSTTSHKTVRNASRSEDLSTVLNITADDEAAKMVDSITLPQMVKVMSALSLKKRRSVLLLRSLSYNITRTTNQLTLKQCSDLLYSVASLNFPDENLLSRIAGDITVELEKDIKKSSLIGSIVTSVGLLKYKNPALLDILSDWILNNHTVCRPQDIFALLMSLAVLNYKPNNIDKLLQIFSPHLTIAEAGKPLVWLDIVWSLTLLEKANDSHISSILDNSFLNLLEEPTSISTKLKLLNIDGAAQHLLDNYKGPRLPPNCDFRKITIPHTKEKTEMVTSILDSLKNLIQSEQLFQTRINSQCGFYIDAVCYLDKKCNPVPSESADVTRIAIMALDFHDMCKGKTEPTGMNDFAIKLLESQGYRVVVVPFTEFKARDKLVYRVQYLENKLKEIVK